MPYEDYSDEELIKMYQETGDSSALLELYKRIRHHLAAMAMDILKEKEDVRDILQDVLLELMSDLQNRDISNFGGFAYIKTRNKCLSFLKRKNRSDQLDLTTQKYPEELVEKPDLDSLNEKPEEAVKLILKECIATLPEKERKCLELFFFYERGDGKFGMRYKEIVKHTGFNLREVTSALQTAKRKVKKCLQSSGIDGAGPFDED